MPQRANDWRRTPVRTRSTRPTRAGSYPNRLGMYARELDMYVNRLEKDAEKADKKRSEALNPGSRIRNLKISLFQRLY